MKATSQRRMRRRPASREAANFKKDNQPEQQFFGETTHEPFFKPVAALQQNGAVQRKCTDCEGEEKAQRSPDKKEEEKKVQRAADKKEEEKVQKKENKKEEKVMKKEDKKEEEKVQKKEDKKEEEKVMKKEDKKEEEKVQKKEAAAVSNTSTTASNYISSINGKGQGMDAGVQSFYESRIGADFSDVKIHTGKEAADSAKDINAQAYAYGNHIVFNESKYQPQSSEGKHLLAHELAHVVQQQSNSKMMLQRIACDGTATAPPRVAQGTRNTIDVRAQAIVDIASGTASAAVKAVSIVTQIICQYFSSDAALVSRVVHNPALVGLDTTSAGSGASTTGIIGVSDAFVQSTTAAYFARRVLQVGHELQHIRQYRTGLAGGTHSNEREFLAYAENALADEFEGTGRMSRSTRLSIVDAAIGYYHCLSQTLKTQYQSRLTALQTRRQTIIATGRVGTPGAEPSSCVQASD